MMRRLLSLLAGCVLSAPALADDPPNADALREAVAAVDAACAADAEAPACVIATLEATPLVTTALATIGETGDRATWGDGVRRYLEARSPAIRAAAAFALAQLFPDETDTPALLALLREPSAGVRLAALAALRASSDPTARILAERTGEVNGVGFGRDRLPYDPAALGVELPADAAYVEFERDEAEEGALLFTTAETQAGVLQALAAQGAHDPFKIASPPGWFGRSEAGALLDRFARRSDSFADMAGLVLEGDAAGPGDQPLRLALAYRDLQLDRTGIALLWSPPDALPRPPRGATVVADDLSTEPATPVADDALALPDPATLGIQPGADPEDTAFYMMVRAGRGAGGDDYLALFPEGAYRQAVIALLATEMVIEPDATRVPPAATITIRFRNMPGNDRDWFTIMPPDAPDDDYDQVALTRGAKDGSVTITAPRDPGEYELRVFFDNSYDVERRIPVIVDPDVETVVDDDTTSTSDATATSDTTTGDTTTTGDSTTTGDAAAGAPALSVGGTIAPRAPIVVHYTGMPGTRGDWITIVPEGTPDTTWGAWSSTHGDAAGEVTLTGQTPGRYEIRAYVETPKREVVARLPVTVAASTAPQTFAVMGQPKAGEPIVVTFTGMPDVAGNWVSIAPVGTPDTQWGSYVYAPAGPDGSVTLPAQPAGQYIVRFFVETPKREVIARLAVGVQ